MAQIGQIKQYSDDVVGTCPFLILSVGEDTQVSGRVFVAGLNDFEAADIPNVSEGTFGYPAWQDIPIDL